MARPSPAIDLQWVSDEQPGYRRVHCRDGFAYFDTQGRRLRRKAELERIRALAIPPAYRDVWICPRADGHLQATGRDARGRKQYRYHPAWQAERSRLKFDQLQDFARQLPALRRQVRRLLRETRTAPGHEQLMALLVRLLDRTGMRIGNEAYARHNGSYGLSTLRRRHALIGDGRLRLFFVGKSGVKHTLEIEDRRLARLVRRCADLPGQPLFQYLDEAGQVHGISSGDVNSWLARNAGPGISAKVFRTWHASVAALELLLDPAGPPPQEVIKAVAQRLGNTAAVCRKSYIHPALIDLLEAGPERCALLAERWAARPPRHAELRLAERQLLALLGTQAQRHQP